MAIPFALPSEDEAETQGQQLEQIMLDLYAALQQVLRSRGSQHPSRNHRVPRRAGDALGTRDHPVMLLDSDLSPLPLPDLVLSAVEQLPATPAQVTVSAPSSPTRDAAFQFPECSNEMPVPSPRPRPRRRRITSEGNGSGMKKGPGYEGVSANGEQQHFRQTGERPWVHVGTNLRNIADDFHASKTKNTELEKARLSAMNPSYAVGRNANQSGTDSLLSLLIPAPLRETLWTTVALYLGWRLVSRLR